MIVTLVTFVIEMILLYIVFKWLIISEFIDAVAEYDEDKDESLYVTLRTAAVPMEYNGSQYVEGYNDAIASINRTLDEF